MRVYTPATGPPASAIRRSGGHRTAISAARRRIVARRPFRFAPDHETHCHCLRSRARHPRRAADPGRHHPGALHDELRRQPAGTVEPHLAVRRRCRLGRGAPEGSGGDCAAEDPARHDGQQRSQPAPRDASHLRRVARAQPRRGVRQPEGRRRQAGHRQRGVEPAGGCRALAVRAGHRVEGARSRGHRPGQGRRLDRRRAQARAARVRAAQDAAPGRAHAAGQRGDAAGRRRRPAVAALRDLQPARQRRLALADDHCARQDHDARPGNLRQAAGGRRPEGARPGLPRVLPRPQVVPAHHRRDLRGAPEGRRVRRARAQVRHRAPGQAG